ncbi:uncharacterized protein [Henckelia pumila]|uniref:uncharacterized protein n=1 Tax=Henckelia pumila TaxID=405737 RepID=UPI003C6E6BDF
MQGPEGDYILKPEATWSTEEILILSFNAKALNAIFSTVDMRMYGIIADCTIAKDEWEALQKHCEESKSVKRTKIRCGTFSAVHLGNNFRDFQLLRVLDLQGAPLTEFPEQITNLILLRYLSLRDTDIKTIPKSIKKLINLKTLDLKQSGDSTSESNLPTAQSPSPP